MDIIARPFTKRAEQEELLDQGAGTSKDVTINLSEMQRINDLLGGTSALTRHLYPMIQAAAKDRNVTVMDLGTGGAGLPLAMTHWAQQNNLAVRVIGVDWARRNLAAAAKMCHGEAMISLLQADSILLPLGTGAVDFVISSLFMHHLKPKEVIVMLQRAMEVARCGLVMSDLVRGRLPYIAFQMIQPVMARNYLTRHDGALSVRRAYTPAELRQLAAEAGLTGARIYTHFPWRMTLVVER